MIRQQESIIMSCEVLKYHKSGKWLQRHILITTHRVMIFKEKNIFRRAFLVKSILAMSKITNKLKFNFAFHIKDEHDLHLYSRELRETIINHVKQCYFSSQSRNLPIYGLSQEIELYLTTKQHFKNNKRALLPADKSRMYEEDIYEVAHGGRKSTL